MPNGQVAEATCPLVSEASGLCSNRLETDVDQTVTAGVETSLAASFLPRARA